VKENKKIEEGLAALIMGAGFLLGFVVAPISAVLTILYWMKNRVWPDWTASGFGLHAPVTSWLGANVIIDHVYHFHIGWIAFWLGLAMIWIGSMLES
jgi:hypothetical protein